MWSSGVDFTHLNHYLAQNVKLTLEKGHFKLRRRGVSIPLGPSLEFMTDFEILKSDFNRLVS